MSNSFKAIETRYQGYRFRSRVEARWAVFFNALGIQWEYEKEGYTLEGVNYLPDFWLPEQDCFIEIKGQMPTEEEIEKAQLLSVYTRKNVFILYGPVEIPSDNFLNSFCCLPPSLWKFKKSEHVVGGPSTIRLDVPPHILAIMQGLAPYNLQLCVRSNGAITFIPYADAYYTDDIDTLIEGLNTQITGLQKYKSKLESYMKEIKESLFLGEEWTYEFLSQMDFDETCAWHECEHCGAFVIDSAIKKQHECGDKTQGNLTQSTHRILDAYAAARSARFEFGEKG